MDDTDFRKTAAATALRSMFRDGHFCICTLDKCLKIMGVQQSPDYTTLSSLHCVKWADMPAGFPQEVMERTLKMVFEGGNVDELITIFSSKQQALPAPEQQDEKRPELGKFRRMLNVFRGKE